MDDTKGERDIRSIFRFEYGFIRMGFIGISRELPVPTMPHKKGADIFLKKRTAKH